jgi:hypothetical protein
LWKSADYLAYGVHELLNLSIDRFHPQRRAVFLKIRKSVVEKCEVLDGRLDEEIRSFAGSPYLDESDDSAYDRTRDRRDYLKSQNALAPAVGPRSARKKSGPRS